MKPKTFDQNDKLFQEKILDALMQRYFINMNKAVCTMHLDPIHEDHLNPCVTITRDDIARETMRDKVRDVVLEEYAKAMKRPFFEVVLDRDLKTLRVCITPVRSPELEFKSLNDLRDKNAADLDDDPELRNNPFA